MNDQTKQAMTMAYVFIESLTGLHREVVEEQSDVLTALREALAQPQEPVAWLFNDMTWTPIREMGVDNAGIPMFAAPPSVEAMRIETLEKAADLREQIALQGVQSSWYEDGFWDGLVAYEKAIRSMK